MGKSDMDEHGDWGECTDNFKMDQDSLEGDKAKIHSGHFMISSLDDEGGAVTENIEPPGYDFSSATQEPANTYTFGEKMAVEIDTSLTSLFQCMSLAYSGRLTSPKWKSFKGLKVSIKEKVRLNNIIWREWHMQYIQGKKYKICQFESPITDKSHCRAEAIVLEGKYWKRKLASVTSEYKKWRMYHKERRRPSLTSTNSTDRMSGELDSQKSNVFRFGQNNRFSECVSPPLDTKTMEEDLMMDLSDTLFSSLSAPFLFPNPREFGQLGNADIIQPGLIQLQPSVEEFMDTLEPLPSLQEMINASKSTGNASAADSLFGDSSILFSQPQSFKYGKDFIGSATRGTDSPQLNNSSSLVNPNIVLGNRDRQEAVSPAEFRDLSASSGYASNSSLLSEAQRLVAERTSATNNTAPQRLSDEAFSPQFSNNSSFSQLNVDNTQPRPNLASSSRQPAPTSQLQPAESSSAANDTSPIGGEGTTSSQPDAAARLLSLILGNNVGGATTQLQQLINSGGSQTPQRPDSILPQQILQLLLQIQQQRNPSAQETPEFTTFEATDSQSSSCQQQQQQAQTIADLLLQPRPCRQDKNTVTFASPSPTAQFASSTPVKPIKQEKPCQVIQYSQLQNLLQGQSLSPVTRVKQPPVSKGSTSQESMVVQRQSSQGSVSHGGTKNQSDRHRSKSGDSFLRQDNRRSSTGSLGASQQKQGRFLVPQSPATPRATTRSLKAFHKQVKTASSTPIQVTNSTISPGSSSAASASTKSSVAAQNTFLAKLLTSEKPTIIKEEQSQPYPTIRPKPSMTKTVALNTNSVTVSTASNIVFPMTVYQDSNQLEFDNMEKNGLSDLQKGMMIAAAGQSFNVSSSVKLSDLLNNSVTIAQCSSTPVIGSISEGGSPQFRVPSPSDNSVDSMQNRSRHSSNDSADSVTPTSFTLEAVKEEQVQSPGRHRRKTELNPVMYKEHRRNCHINAEQKRRYNIKHGFDTLCVLVPTLTQNPNAKVSKAAILQKSAEHCAKLKKEKAEMHAETDRLKQEIEALNNAIGNCQSQLPATGVPVNRQRANKMREKFDEYVKQRTLQNWKFWIFSMIVSPLFETYNNTVSVTTLEEMCRSALSWQDQHCSLTVLRKVVVESLQKLSTSTDILSEPSKLPEQAIQAVQQQSQPDGGDGH